MTPLQQWFSSDAVILCPGEACAGGCRALRRQSLDARNTLCLMCSAAIIVGAGLCISVVACLCVRRLAMITHTRRLAQATGALAAHSSISLETRTSMFCKPQESKWAIPPTACWCHTHIADCHVHFVLAPYVSELEAARCCSMRTCTWCQEQHPANIWQWKP